jgi:hypothetical protein
MSRTRDVFATRTISTRIVRDDEGNERTKVTKERRPPAIKAPIEDTKRWKDGVLVDSREVEQVKKAAKEHQVRYFMDGNLQAFTVADDGITCEYKYGQFGATFSAPSKLVKRWCSLGYKPKKDKPIPEALGNGNRVFTSKTPTSKHASRPITSGRG